jgi:hypothetical protein
MNITYTQEPACESRAETRRRPVKRLRVVLEKGSAFNGWLIARTAKGQLPALDRSLRSKYSRHVGAKQMAKLSK